MRITITLILTYIVYCLRVGAAPWKYFQLNERYFSKDQGIFSKLSIDTLIPDRWRLHQVPDEPTLEPEQYPVFLKPEWGQNAHGIYRADSWNALQSIRQTLKAQDGEERYILQEGAPGKREFEVFSIDANKNDGSHDVVTVTEAVNDTESFPINSKNNTNTRYVDISSEFTQEQLTTLGRYLDEVGSFAISRMSARADSIEELVDGNFHVIEVNLFLPMPINLLDERYDWKFKFSFIRRAMKSLALATKAIKPADKPAAIFTRMMLYGRSRSSARKMNNLATRRSIT